MNSPRFNLECRTHLILENTICSDIYYVLPLQSIRLWTKVKLYRPSTSLGPFIATECTLLVVGAIHLLPLASKHIPLIGIYRTPKCPWTTQTLVEYPFICCFTTYYFLTCRLFRPLQQIVIKDIFWSCITAEVWYFFFHLASQSKLLVIQCTFLTPIV